MYLQIFVYTFTHTNTYFYPYIQIFKYAQTHLCMYITVYILHVYIFINIYLHMCGCRYVVRHSSLKLVLLYVYVYDCKYNTVIVTDETSEVSGFESLPTEMQGRKESLSVNVEFVKVNISRTRRAATGSDAGIVHSGHRLMNVIQLSGNNECIKCK